MKHRILTKGNVEVQNIKIGDLHFEYDYGIGIKCEVISLPVKESNGYWTWKSKNCKTGRTIEYGVSEEYPHYGPNLYDYEAYTVKHYI